MSTIEKYRLGIAVPDFVNDTPTKTYSNIANTFFNYISLTQYTERGLKSLSIKQGKEDEVDEFIESIPSFISHPEITENYQRRFGRGKVAINH